MKWISMLSIASAWFGILGCGPGEPPSCLDSSSPDLDESCGIWVSATLGDDANPGTRAAPMASLNAAAQAAYREVKNVYACGELWTEPMLLPKNVSLFGGFDCANGWHYRGAGYRARLETGPDVIPLTTDGFGGYMKIADMEIGAASATLPGGSSIAVMIGDVNHLSFERCTLKAGDAKAGLSAEKHVEPAAVGTAGSPGADACTAADGPGGTAAETVCGPDEISLGGKGGNGGAVAGLDGDPGSPASNGQKDPNNLGDGDGGGGQTGVGACTPGEPGATGAEGKFSEGKRATRGLLTAKGFFSAGGDDGEPGKPGQGGGGGGGSRGGAAVCGALPGGAGGGSGGAGGCGGKGGRGGQGGGSSFTVAVIGEVSTIFFESCELWVGLAGDGGSGGKGQEGGQGGAAGPGGSGNGSAQAGCEGGTGGAGGKGGGGAGGNGGHSKHIAFDTAARISIFPETLFLGKTDGWGGHGGNGGDVDPNSDGVDGAGNLGDYATAVIGIALDL